MKMSGTIYKVAGPVVVAENMQPQMYDVVYVGDEELMGEVIQIEDDKCHIQVYEDTTGVKPGEPVTNTEHPLSVELGPGLLGSIYDGLQRPLVELQKLSGDFIERGEDAPGIDLEKEYDFSPRVEEGDKVRPGQVIGTTEVKNGKHRVMVPPNVEGGKVEKVKSGEQTVKETVVKLESGEEISMRQEWPIRQSRPVQEELKPEVPLVTGQRVLDGLFPLAKGGTAAIPGPFGSGKCVTGDTPVMLADGSKKPIKELYDSHKNKGDRTIEENEQWTNLDEPLNVLSKKDGELVEKEADVVYKGKTSSTIEINSKSGRNIELTPVHKLFVLTPEMEVIEKQAQNIESDDTLIIPRNLPIDAEDQELNVSTLLPEKRVVGTDFEKAQEAIELLENKFSSRKQVAKEIGAKPHKLDSCAQGKNRPKVKLATELIEKSGIEHRISKVKGERQAKTVDVPSKITEEFAELLGLLLGDGSLKPKSVHFYNNDEKLLKRVEDLIKSLFELETERETANTVESVKVNSKAFRDLLVELGFPEKKKSLNCSIPEKVLQSSDRVIAGFIRGYFLADGGFNKYNVEISTSSEKMQEDLSYSLTRLGTVPRLSEKETSASKHYRVRLSGSELKTFHEKTKTDHQKYRKIQAYLENTERHFRGNESVDISADTVHKAFKESDTKRIKLEKHGIELSNYTQLGENMSVPVLQDFADLTNNEELQAISGNHLEHFYPDPVTSVNVKEDLKDVYDLTVPETHNFVGGNAPMILHNTVTQQSLAKYSDADIIVYIGCGERGNEMTEVLEEFPELEDPQTGDKIINRTVLIANTSNMPVAAREASIYTGVTIAEYFRDQGLDVALMADSTSRWAEAMREVSARLEEMPGERGYPAYLSSRLAEFYERAGRVQPLGPEDTGSVSIVGAVSPPGGDFSEPVTQNTLRVVKNFWALDSDLAEKRHFPSINWDDSYSGYKDKLSDYFEEEVDEEWQSNIQRMRNILQKDGELQETVQLVGKDALPDRERLTLEVGSMIKRFYLQQNAFHPVDEYSPPEKTYHILDLVLDWADEAYSALEDGAVVENIISLKSKNRISELPTSEDYLEVKEDVKNQMNEEFKEVRN